MSDFKEGDLLEHVVSGERCVVVTVIAPNAIEVATSLSAKYEICRVCELTKVKEESND